MCINFNGYHSGGSSFINVNDCWLEKYIYIRSPSIWFRTPKPVRIRQSGRTGIGGVTFAPIIISPYWSLPCEIMCDASDFSIGSALGQHLDKIFQAIYYASCTLNEPKRITLLRKKKCLQ